MELRSAFFDLRRLEERLNPMMDSGEIVVDYSTAETKPRKKGNGERVTSDLIWLPPASAPATAYCSARRVGAIVFDSACYDGTPPTFEDSWQYERLRLWFEEPMGLNANWREAKIMEIPRAKIDLTVTFDSGGYYSNRIDSPLGLRNWIRERGPNFKNKMRMLLPDDSIIKPEVLSAVNSPTAFHWD